MDSSAQKHNEHFILASFEVNLLLILLFSDDACHSTKDISRQVDELSVYLRLRFASIHIFEWRPIVLLDFKVITSTHNHRLTFFTLTIISDG